MGPEGPWSTSMDASRTKSAAFATNSSHKHRYRDVLKQWVRLLCVAYQVDPKAKAALHMPGFLILPACDGIAQEMLRQAGRSEKLSLETDDTDAESDRSCANLPELIVSCRAWVSGESVLVPGSVSLRQPVIQMI